MAASKNWHLSAISLSRVIVCGTCKTKSGHGEDTCTLLLKLSKASLKNKFRLKKKGSIEERGP